MKRLIMLLSMMTLVVGLSACTNQDKAFNGLWIYENGTWNESELIRIEPFIDEAFVLTFEVETEGFARMYKPLEKYKGLRKLAMVPKDGYLTGDGIKVTISEDGKTLTYKNRQFTRASEGDIERLKNERATENNRLNQEQAQQDLQDECERIRLSFKGNFEDYQRRARNPNDPVKLADEIKDAESIYIEQAQAAGLPNCLDDLLHK